MVDLKFSLMRRDFVWIGVLIVFLGVGFVYAYGGSNPSVMGHSGGELEININGEVMMIQEAINDGKFRVDFSEVVPICMEDLEVLQFDGTDFICSGVGGGLTPCDWEGWASPTETFLTCPSFAPGCECLDTICQEVAYCEDDFITETKNTCGCVECGTGCYF